ncbi:hypothetical protein SSX86_012078 [Deinandra increscens subsp. villosa]|uniref:CCT domain-containing protein n=1 Tax=Deinandra increscens subsp. villosa TaxID=3103831 RepID=A0AAP0D8P0_9ASTR
MSCDLSGFEECFFNDPFSPFSDSASNDILKTFQQPNYNLDPLSTHNILDSQFDEIDQNAPTLSSSPPCHHLETLHNYQMGNSVNSLDLCPLEIKAEESQLPFYDYNININSFLPQSYGVCDNSVKMMQRGLIESSNLHSLSLTSPDHGCLSSSHMRRVCSTGDLHSLETKKALAPSALATQGSLIDEANFKVGRYSPEERKQRILRYKAKRTQRNFNKTIKYACRKTLADNRPRVRGRFARNDEPEQASKGFTFQRYEDNEELWRGCKRNTMSEQGDTFSTPTCPPPNFINLAIFLNKGRDCSNTYIP